MAVEPRPRHRPVYPKNLYAERAPYTHAEFREQVIERQIELMVSRGVWVDPGKQR
ncbi:hypothetical protein [Pseudonocardia acidicola]|uniref:hypothetical protein n=1 Tax=Pseudonocardia acidicola TaxID=2724939 RepID=UPI001EEF9E67|nr:hypothetical protein [Pseudonocardia acidicola]